MKKDFSRFVGISIMLVLTVVLSYGCGSSPKSSDPVAAGIKAIQNNDPVTAKNVCTPVLKSNPNNHNLCGCSWVMALADVQDIANNQIQPMVNNLFQAAMNDQLATLFTGMLPDLQDIPTRTAAIESNGCEVTISTVPLNKTIDLSALSAITQYISITIPSSLAINLQFGNQWGPPEAEVLGAASNVLQAVINDLSGATLDTSCLIGQATALMNLFKGFKTDLIGTIRQVGPIFAACPTFLGGTTDFATRMAIVNTEVQAAINEINNESGHVGLNDSLIKDEGNPAKVLFYTKTNNDRVVDHGDTLKVGCTVVTTSTNCIASLASSISGLINLSSDIGPDGTITIPSEVQPSFVPALETFGTNVVSNLSNGSYAWFTPKTDINPLLEGLSMTGDDFSTSVIELSVYNFFQSPQPLRYFFPNVDAVGQFEIEAEVAGALPGQAWYYMATNPTDVAHFTDATGSGTNISITADGISVPSRAAIEPDVLSFFEGLGITAQATPAATIPYISFSDPTLDGMIKVDLSQLLMFCDGQPPFTGYPNCPASTAAGFSTSTNYLANKIIAAGVFGLFTDSTTAHWYTETTLDHHNPIW